MKNYPKNSSDSVSKGQRLEIVRDMTYLGRTGFCAKYHFKTETFRSWENGLHGGLPLKRAKELQSIFLKEGLNVSVEWLMQGVGEEPEYINLDHIIEIVKEHLKNDLRAAKNFDHITDDDRMAEELKFFELGQQRGEIISLTVQDDGMSPFYNQGDLVAGIKYYDKEIKKLKDQDCIVTILGDGEQTLIRRIKPSKEKERYDLVCVNLDTKVKAPVLKKKQLISAAPIVWCKKPVHSDFK